MIIFPLQIDEDGGLFSSNDPIQLAGSEVNAILDTILWSRPLRIDYGTSSYVLTALELGQLLVDLSAKLFQGLSALGFTNIEVNNISTTEDFQSGIIKLDVRFKYGGETESLYYKTNLDNLRDRAAG